MIIRTYYIASDGERFDSEEACLAHEKDIDLSMVPMLDCDGLATPGLDDCFYAYLRDEEITDRFFTQIKWYGIESEGLDTPGLYFYDGEIDEWVLLDVRINEMEAELSKLIGFKEKLLAMAKDKEEK